MHIQHDDGDPAHTCPVCGDNQHARDWANPEVWLRQDMRLALARRDIQAVYQILQRFGMSQRKIGARTDQTQSEVSDIINGRRVSNYDVLVRIADGIGVPRGWMGLAHDTDDGPVDQALLSVSMSVVHRRWWTFDGLWTA